MRYFVTGASGWIGSAVTAELLSAGHRVDGLARSDAAAARISAAGATPVRGELTDLDVLRSAAAEADGVVHLGFIHDFANYAESGRIERAVVEAFGDELAGSDRPLLIASGIAGLSDGRPATELDPPPASGPDAPRGGGEALVLSFADRGIRALSSRFAPTVHGAGDHGFIATIVDIARRSGVSGYVGDGGHRWAGVHRSDAARGVRLAVEGAPAGSILHLVAEEGWTTREIAEAIGAGLDLPVRSVDPADADAHFGWMGRFFGAPMPATSALTRELLGWEPVGPTLLDDLAVGGPYFADPSAR